MDENKSPPGQKFAAILGVLTVLATAIAAVPSFLQLNRDRPLVYHQVQSISVVNPESPDARRVIQVLRMNRVPTARTVVQIQNKGQGPAKEVRIGIQTYGPLFEVTTDPSPAERPVWVSLPTPQPDYRGDSVATMELANLAPGKVFEISVAYDAGLTRPAATDVDVYYDGKPARRVPNLAAAPELSVGQTFRVPLIIFAAGTSLTILVAGFIVLRRNDDLARALWRLIKEAIYLAIPIP